MPSEAVDEEPKEEDPNIGSSLEKHAEPELPEEPVEVSSEDEDYSQDDEDTMRSKKAIKFTNYLEKSGIELCFQIIFTEIVKKEIPED